MLEALQLLGQLVEAKLEPLDRASGRLAVGGGHACAGARERPSEVEDLRRHVVDPVSDGSR
jgi:sirohydrochlorin ferrochelatase